MEYRELGGSGLRVSGIGFGCWALSGDYVWGPQEEEDSIAAIHAALDAGINFFDTAAGYGDGKSEVMLGKALKDRRQEALIATKFPGGTRAQIVASCEKSLARLGVNEIDLYQLHWPYRNAPVAETLDALDRLQAQGKIRAYGVCNFGPGDLAEAQAARAPIRSNQLPYSLLWRAIEFEILPICVPKGIAILPYMPLMQGLLADKFRTADAVPPERARTRHFSSRRPMARHGEPGCEAETFDAIARIRSICAGIGQPMSRVALAWLLRQEGVASVLVGARSPQQARDNAAAAALDLSPDVVRELAAATDTLKSALGANCDLWQPQAQSRYR